MKFAAWLLPLSLLVSAVPAWACGCSIPPTPQAFEDASSVFIAELVSAKYTPWLHNFFPLSGDHQETATFQVKKAWKGAQVGQQIEFISEFQGRHGLCGDSFRGRSDLRKELWGGRPELQVPGNSNEWLIFVTKEDGLSLSLCSKAEPMNLKWAREEEEVLDRLTSENAK